jgi:hypothetical protein
MSTTLATITATDIAESKIKPGAAVSNAISTVESMNVDVDTTVSSAKY